MTDRYNDGDFVIIRVYISAVDRMCSSEWICINDDLLSIKENEKLKTQDYAKAGRTYSNRNNIQQLIERF